LGTEATKTPLAMGLVTNRRLFRNCITKPCQLAHRPFGCSAVITMSYIRRLLRWTFLFSAAIAKL